MFFFKKNARIKKILIVEDDQETADFMRVLLANDGHQILEAASGRAGVESALKHIPDLIIMDIMMSGMDGYEAAHRIRNNPKTEHIPIMMCTALDRIGDMEKGLAWGAIDYIAKPFDHGEFRAKVDKLLSPRPDGTA